MDGMETTIVTFIDSHAHLDFKEYDEDRKATIERAAAASVELILQIAMGPEEERLKKCYEIVENHPNFFMAVGLHPHEADHFSEEVYERIQKYLKKEKVVAVGEIGLDYYYEYSDREKQKRCFAALMDLALEKNLPICVHTRDAFDDTLLLTREKKIFERTGGVIHCFTGDSSQAEQFLELGAYISFSGVVTFKNARQVQEAAKVVPLERMLIETDSPFLSPIPHRGKRNEPAYVVEVARTIASIKGCSTADVAEHTSKNARALFKI